MDTGIFSVNKPCVTEVSFIEIMLFQIVYCIRDSDNRSFFEQTGTQWLVLCSSLSTLLRFCLKHVNQGTRSTRTRGLKDILFFTPVIFKYMCLCKGM